jgi:hypothetical protein
MNARVRADSQSAITLVNRPKPICAACAAGHHEQPTQEPCCCPCHGTIPAMQQQVAA